LKKWSPNDHSRGKFQRAVHRITTSPGGLCGSHKKIRDKKMHKSLVFLSCGQRDTEGQLAKNIEKMITTDLNMDCYNADSVHGFDDVMSITEKLAIADYYIMIDFLRNADVPLSVFTHQEFALARAWDIDKVLVFQEEGQKSHGMLSYVLAHPISFTRNELVETVREAILNQKWNSDYSRNLIVSKVEPSELVLYGDHTGQSMSRVWHLTIHNCRKDKAAVNTIAILNSIRICKTGELIDSPDRSYLKWVHQKEGYIHTILPQDHAALDAFAIRAGEQGIFLLSRHDTSPRQPVVIESGEYVFNYNIYSANFPLLKVAVRINYIGPIQIRSNVVDNATRASIEKAPSQ
jgi:hypothetical protein